MKIAITGQTGEVGSALADSYRANGHTVIGLSRSTGFIDSDIDKMVDTIKECDVFVNMYSTGFFQTELLFRIHNTWLGLDKTIVNISSISTVGYYSIDVNKSVNKHIYKHEKLALEDAHWLLNTKNILQPRMVLVKVGPGPETSTWQQVTDYIVTCLEHGITKPYLLELTVAK